MQDKLEEDVTIKEEVTYAIDRLDSLWLCAEATGSEYGLLIIGGRSALGPNYLGWGVEYEEPVFAIGYEDGSFTASMQGVLKDQSQLVANNLKTMGEAVDFIVKNIHLHLRENL